MTFFDRTQQSDAEEPYFVISVAARMIGVHAQTLRAYERMGLIAPARSQGNIRLYSRRDLERVRRVRTLMEDLGVNLAGVDVILRLMDRVNDLEADVLRLKDEVVRLRASQYGHPLARRDDPFP